MNCERRIICCAERALYGAVHTHFAGIGICGVVINVQLITRLELLIQVTVKRYRDVLHLGGVLQILAENVSHGINAGLKTACVLNSLTHCHAVVKAECTAERLTHLTVHADSLNVAVCGLCQNPYNITCLEFKISVSIDSRERNCQYLNGLIGLGTLHKYIIGLGCISGLCLHNQTLQAAVALQVIVAAVVNIAVNGHVILHRHI